MQFSSKEKNYTDSPSVTGLGSDLRLGDKFSSPSYQLPSKRQGSDIKRPTMMESAKNDELFEAFPQLTIHRVDSSEHREKLKTQPPPGTSFLNMTNSLIQKPTYRGDSKLTSTSVEKISGTNLTYSKQGSSSYNQLQTNKASYKLNYATYKKEGNVLSPNYAYGANSQDGSQNEVPAYKRINNVMTLEKMDMQISPKMVSSVISRGSSGKQLSEQRYNQRVYLSTSDKNQRPKGEEDEAYDMYASRHPNESIRKSTIQISKAISSNAITQLQRQNENQQKKIKKLQKQLQQFKQSLKKWDEIKHRYQLDLESKSRQIFDLERVNKRLSQQVQGIRAYRTMDTVQQVIIVRLKEQVMQLNKKIISMQADHYKNQKMLIEKQKKDGSSTAISSSESEETIKKLQQQLFINKKQSQLLGVELQKQKEKAWTLQKQKEEYLAQKSIYKQNYEQELNGLKKQLFALKQEAQKNIDTLKSKDTLLSQKLQQQKKLFQNDLSQKLLKKQQQYRAQLSKQLSKKQQQYRNKLNQQMRLYQSKIIQQGKNQKLLQQQQKQQLQNLKQQKQQNQAKLKQKIAQFQQNLKLTSAKLQQKQQSINNDYLFEIQNLKKILNQNQNYIRDVENQNANIKAAIRERQVEIDRLKADNMKIVDDYSREVNSKSKWQKQQAFIIQSTVKAKFQAQYKQRQKQLQAKSQALEQNVKQMKVKLQKQQQQQTAKAQTQARQKQIQSLKDLESTKLKITDEVKKAELNLTNINKQISTITARKSQLQSQLTSKQKQVKDAQQQFVQLQAKIQSKTAQVSQLQNQKKLLTVQAQKLKQQEQKQKVVNKQLQNKYNVLTLQNNSLKIQFAKLQQKTKQLQIQSNRATQSSNTWKSKSQNLQTVIQKSKKDLAALEKERNELKSKVEGHKAKAQIVKKYQQLLPEYEVMKQKLLLKEEQITNREASFFKARQQVQSIQSKASTLIKQIKNLNTKLVDTESKMGTLLSKAEADEHKYKQVQEKMVNDAKVYMAFIKKLQEDNELVSQKYWKIRKLVKKEKINDDNDLLQKYDYGTFKQYMELEVASHFKRIIIPAFQSKIMQKLSACQTNITNKYKKLAIVKALVQQVKRKRQAQKAKLKAK